MYLYLYAPFLRNKKYASDLALFEGRITDFGISGKIAQLSQFLKFAAAIKEFGMRRLTTLVLVGDDELLEEGMNFFALSPVVLGFIPMIESSYAQALSIPQGPVAAEQLAARRIVKLDLGKIGERFFLGKARCEGKGIEVHTPTFSIFPRGHAVVEIRNLSGELSGAVDGALDVQVVPFEGTLFRKPSPATGFKVTSCRIKSGKPMLVECGAAGRLKTPLQVDIVPGAIKMVVGRKMPIIRSRKR